MKPDPSEEFYEAERRRREQSQPGPPPPKTPGTENVGRRPVVTTDSTEVIIATGLTLEPGDTIEFRTNANGVTEIVKLDPPNRFRRLLRRFALWTLRLSGDTTITYQDRRTGLVSYSRDTNDHAIGRPVDYNAWRRRS